MLIMHKIKPHGILTPLFTWLAFALEVSAAGRSKMLSSLIQQNKIKDVSVIRRLAFAASFLPRTMPAYWESVTSFAVLHRPSRSDQ